MRSAEFAKEAMKANQASAKAGAAHAKKLERMRNHTGFTAAQYGPQFDRTVSSDFICTKF